MSEKRDKICPACGYPELRYGPYIIGTSESYEICPCCGFEFGVTDMDEGYSYEQWRQKWIDEGMKWWSKSRHPSTQWNPVEQLRNIGVAI